MSLKLILGIVLPLLGIITLIFLSQVGPGLNINTDDVNSVDYNKLITANNVVLVRTVTVNNNFFLPRRYELPLLIACLNDKEGTKQIKPISLTYDTVSYVDQSGVPIFGQIAESSRYYYDYGRAQKKNVEVKAYGQKEIKVQIKPGFKPDYYYSYDYQDNSLYGYDEILLVEPKKTSESNDYYYNYESNSCNKLDKADLEKAAHISIVNIPAFTTTTTSIYPYYYSTTTIISCYDTDGLNLNTRGYSYTSDYSTSLYDICANSTHVYEYYCSTSLGTPQNTRYACGPGKKCVDGACF